MADTVSRGSLEFLSELLFVGLLRNPVGLDELQLAGLPASGGLAFTKLQLNQHSVPSLPPSATLTATFRQ